MSAVGTAQFRVQKTEMETDNNNVDAEPPAMLSRAATAATATAAAHDVDATNRTTTAPTNPTSPTSITDKVRHSAQAVATTTKQSAHVVADKTKEILDKTTTTTKKVIHHTSHQVEHNKFCFAIKCLVHFPHAWPRTCAFLFGVVLPLWILIFLGFGFGILLAQYESGTEIAGNDAILAARAQIDYFSISTTKLLSVTLVCLANWEREVLLGEEEAAFLGGNNSMSSLILEGDGGGEETLTFDTLENNDTLIELGQLDQDGDGFVSINRTLLELSLDECTQSYIPQLEDFQESQVNNSLAFESLSFNWNRCWDQEQFGTFIFYPTDAMKVASRPDAQEEYYQQEWVAMQQELYFTFLPPNASPEEQYQAFLQSADEATGDDACHENTGGTAWFFFTIMTTVGYGNQAPVTDEGRLLIVTAGLFSLILFGAVLGLTSFIILAIFDDFVSRYLVSRYCISKWLQHPVVGMLMWGAIWMTYAVVIATDVEYWWEERLPDYAEGIDRSDTLWFAFISTSTIGLGDYFLQPEVVFASDTLKYSVLFMVGFVFLSTFFGKIAAALGYLLPQKHNSLDARLKATRVLACWPSGFMPWEQRPGGGGGGDTDNGGDGEGITMDFTEMPADDQALIYRIGQLKELKPDPPTTKTTINGNGNAEEGEDDEGFLDEGIISNYTGNPIRSMNVELLEQEESLLREWLAVVQYQQRRAKRHKSLEQELDVASMAASKDPELNTILEEALPTGSGASNSTGIANQKDDDDNNKAASTSTADQEVSSSDGDDKNSTFKNNNDKEKKDQVSGAPSSTNNAALPSVVNEDEDDNQTVVTSAEETFNPLASFFSTA